MSRKAPSILTSGFVALDVILHGEQVGHAAGGTAGNVAANCAYLGWRAATAALVGDDPAGAQLTADLQRAGVSTEALVRQEAAQTPVVIHEVHDNGHRFRFGCPSCGRRFPRSRPAPWDILEPFILSDPPAFFFFDRLSKSALQGAAAVRDRGGAVVFEPSMPGRGDAFRRAMQVADVVKYSSERMPAFADLLVGGKDDQIQIMTEGSSGAQWRRGRGSWQRQEPFATRVADTAGAGDWMTAGFLVAIGDRNPTSCLDEEIHHALTLAQALAAVSCGMIGARGLSKALESAPAWEVATSLAAAGDHEESVSPRLRRSKRNAGCPSCLSAVA